MHFGACQVLAAVMRTWVGGLGLQPDGFSARSPTASFSDESYARLCHREIFQTHLYVDVGANNQPKFIFAFQRFFKCLIKLDGHG